MRVQDPATHYELGKLRGLHDRWVHHDYKRRGIAGAFMSDPETIYHLDAIDALIQCDAPEEQ
jgi:hypothetical protein